MTNLKNTTETFNTCFAAFLAKVTEIVQSKDKVMCPSQPVTEMSFEDGRRYVKIVKTWCGSNSVYCFIDKTNGDILKASSWKAPAKHARGNIFCDDITAAVTAYGAIYLR